VHELLPRAVHGNWGLRRVAGRGRVVATDAALMCRPVGSRGENGGYDDGAKRREQERVSTIER